MPHFAANITMLFTEWPFLDRIQAAADAGFSAVECLFPYEHPPEDVARQLERAGIPLVLFNVAGGDWAAGERGLAALAQRKGEFEAALARGLHYAQICNVKRLHVMAGLADSRDGGAFERFCDALELACMLGARQGLRICIEPINGRDMPGYFLNDFTLAERIFARVRQPNLALQFDIYHRQILHGDVLRGLEQWMPRIGHVQVASVPLRHEPLSGELDDAVIFDALDALGYEGFVGCEYRPAAGTLAGLGWRESYARRAKRNGA